MRVVRLVADRIERDVLQPLQLGQFRFRKPAHVRDIGDLAEPVAEHRHRVVPAADRDDFDPVSPQSLFPTGRQRIFDPFGFVQDFAGKGQAAVRKAVAVAGVMDPDQFPGLPFGIDDERLLVNQMDMPFRRSGVFLFGKRVAVFAAEGIEHFPFAVDFHAAAVDVIERAHVVQSARMVFVVVGQQDGVQVAEPGPEHLAAEIRSGVDEDLQAAVFHIDRGAQPFVPGIGAAAPLAGAADDRDPLGCPRSEKCQFRIHPMTMSSKVLIRAGSNGRLMRI